jgi:hypothetical protein
MSFTGITKTDREAALLEATRTRSFIVAQLDTGVVPDDDELWASLLAEDGEYSE